MERESFEDFARRLGIFLDELSKTILAADEEPAEEIDDPYYIKPHHTSDFLCICRSFLRLDRIPWYTSGFK